MADLSNYSPIYVRSTGNDSTGNGSLNNPFLTAQKAFEHVYQSPVLLMHFDDSNNSTSFVDNGTGFNITALGNARISTNQSMTGDSSAYFDGVANGSRLVVNNFPSFRTSDFTIEFWLYPVALDEQGLTHIIGKHISGINADWLIGIDASNYLNFVSPNIGLSVSQEITYNEWTHYAIVKNNGVLNIYINGQLDASCGDTYYYGDTIPLTIGGDNSGTNCITAYIDELRITYEAKYTANFSPSMGSLSEMVMPLTVLDFGSGNFGNISLDVADAIYWPPSLSIRGVNASASSISNIVANGENQLYDYDNSIEIYPAANGKNITIISNQTISIGSISSNGGDNSSESPSAISGNGGLIILEDVICTTIYANAGSVASGGLAGGNGGTVTLFNIICEAIYCNAHVNDEIIANNFPFGGNVSLYNTICDYVSCLSVHKDFYGSVYLNDKSQIPYNIYASSTYSNNLIQGYGIDKSNILGLI